MNWSDDEFEWELRQQHGSRRGVRIVAVLIVLAMIVPLVLGALVAIF